jgi:hypothetical protein
MHAALSILMISLLAFGVGFATQRGSVCGLLAARQIVETGRATRLLAFVTASLWALVIVVPLSWVTRGSFVLSPSYDAAAVAVIGGALYGLGTSLNGACMFGTLSRIASGNLSFIAALPGIALGARVATTIASPSAFTLTSPLREPSLGGFALLLLAAGLVGLTAAGIIRTHRRAGLHVGQVLRAARWRTSVAMTIIGVLGGLLFATGAPWSYSTLLRLGEHQEATLATATIVGPLGALAGALAAAALGGRFALRAPSGVQLGRSLIGGGIMGFAIILVPGGNATLLLSALPSLARHGALAYLSMLSVQVLLAMVAKQWKQHNLRAAAAAQRSSAKNAPLKRAAQRSSHHHVGMQKNSNAAAH